jgi:hypothetical protein
MKLQLRATLVALAITTILALFFSVTPEGKADILKILLIGLIPALIGSAIALTQHFVKKRRERKKSQEVQAILANLRNTV